MADGEEGGAAVASTQAAQQVDLETAVETHHDITPEELDRKHEEYLHNTEFLEGTGKKLTPNQAVQELQGIKEKTEFIDTPLEGKLGKEKNVIDKLRNSAYATILRALGKTGKNKMQDSEKQYLADRAALTEQLNGITEQLKVISERGYELEDNLDRIRSSGLEAKQLRQYTITQIEDLSEKLKKGVFKDPKEVRAACKLMDTYKSRLDTYKNNMIASTSKFRMGRKELEYVADQKKDMESLKAEVYEAIETFDLAYASCPNSMYEKLDEIKTSVAQVHAATSSSIADVLARAKKVMGLQTERDRVLNRLDLSVSAKPLDQRSRHTQRDEKCGELSAVMEKTLEDMESYTPYGSLNK